MKITQHLPVEAYTSSKYFALEQAHIFSNTWAFAGFIEELKQSGEYLTVQAGLNNILVIKENGEHLSAFHNMCRHRGTKLVEGRGQTKNKFVCPYHDWSYNLQGELLSLPKAKQEFPSMNKACLNLKKASVGIWRGMIWVHPDPDAIPVENWFAGMDEHLGPHNVESLIEPESSVIVEEIQANWKVIVENYIDHYHLAHLHAGTLNMYDHKSAEFGFVGPHFRFWEPLTKDYQHNIVKNSPYPLVVENKSAELGAWVPMLFPGIGLAESESTWSIFQVLPINADKSKVVIRTKMKNCSMLSYIKQGISSANYWGQKVKAKNANYSADHPLGSADFMKEDIFVCEQLQKSFASPYFEFGPSALKSESPIREHQQLVAQWLEPWLK